MRDSTEISSSEILMAQNRLITMTQKAYFPEDYMALSIKKELKALSSLLNLNPFIDEDGIMRICGWLVSSSDPTLQLKIFPTTCKIYSRDIPSRLKSISLKINGPFDLKSYPGRYCRITKGYVCVFVCFTTKAIHLEATSDLSKQAFLAAFKRFVSRRGCPLHLHSDNGTNFVEASKIIAKQFVKTSKQAIESSYALQNNFKHTFEEFQTLLAKIEACLNSRLLSSTSQEPSDISALTPGHFLIGGPILSPIHRKN